MQAVGWTSTAKCILGFTKKSLKPCKLAFVARLWHLTNYNVYSIAEMRITPIKNRSLMFPYLQEVCGIIVWVQIV